MEVHPQCLTRSWHFSSLAKTLNVLLPVFSVDQYGKHPYNLPMRHWTKKQVDELIMDAAIAERPYVQAFVLCFANPNAQMTNEYYRPLQNFENAVRRNHLTPAPPKLLESDLIRLIDDKAYTKGQQW